MPDLTPNDPIARLVRDLPEDSPSMMWRAGLNEKLRHEATRQTRARRWSFGSLGLGLAAASFAALAVLPMLAGPTAISRPLPIASSVSPPMVAADDLLAFDREGATLAEVSGAGLAARESDLTEGEVRDLLTSQML